MPRKKAPKSMSADHKAALAEGRTEGRAVREYLELLDQKKQPGRRRTPESLRARLGQIEADLSDAGPVARLSLVQERRDIERSLSSVDDVVDTASIEKAFVKVAKSYSDRKGIEYASWREVGVPAAVLKAAGVNRTR